MFDTGAARWLEDNSKEPGLGRDGGKWTWHWWRHIDLFSDQPSILPEDIYTLLPLGTVRPAEWEDIDVVRIYTSKKEALEAFAEAYNKLLGQSI